MRRAREEHARVAVALWRKDIRKEERAFARYSARRALVAGPLHAAHGGYARDTAVRRWRTVSARAYVSVRNPHATTHLPNAQVASNVERVAYLALRVRPNGGRDLDGAAS